MPLKKNTKAIYGDKILVPKNFTSGSGLMQTEISKGEARLDSV